MQGQTLTFQQVSQKAKDMKKIFDISKSQLGEEY